LACSSGTQRLKKQNGASFLCRLQPTATEGRRFPENSLNTISMQPAEELIRLAHELGREDRKLSILGEGNVSCAASPSEFLVKASGSQLGTLSENDLTLCKKDEVSRLLEKKTIGDADMEKALLDARVNEQGKKPSTEAVFHAWLLGLDQIGWVGHCHPTSVNQVLCSPRARDFAERRLFPDEVVCCGPASVFIPYTDPGLPLAREIRDRTTFYIKQHGSAPRLILLQNHGLIAIGATSSAVLACVLMATKAAEIFAGAAALGGPNFMAPKDVERIASRPDELYRQRQLNL
jgi:rhamnose utilization protein RhaD (predicted bifunctional aldolase and dehydrogenase)